MNRLISWSTPFWLFVALVPACGGDDGNGGSGVSSAQLVSTCKKTCEKEKGCLGAEANVLDCNQVCSPDKIPQNGTSNSKATCDYAEVKSKLEACLDAKCEDLESCMDDATRSCRDASSGDNGSSGVGTGGKSGGVGVPTGSAGDGSQGTGGSDGDDSGSGGAVGIPSSGSGEGSSDCSVCAQAAACCKALIGLSGDQQSATCDAFSQSAPRIRRYRRSSGTQRG